MQFLKDIPVGTVIEVDSHIFQEADMIRFAEKFDRQTFHLDPVAAKDTFFGGLIASGWYTASIFMKLLVTWFHAEDQKRRDQNLPPAQRSASPGLLDVRWPTPVRVGDTVTYRTEVTQTRRLKSRPGWGIMTMNTVAKNQNDKIVLSMTGYTIMEWDGPEKRSQD